MSENIELKKKISDLFIYGEKHIHFINTSSYDDDIIYFLDRLNRKLPGFTDLSDYSKACLIYMCFIIGLNFVLTFDFMEAIINGTSLDVKVNMIWE